MILNRMKKCQSGLSSGKIEQGLYTKQAAASEVQKRNTYHGTIWQNRDQCFSVPSIPKTEIISWYILQEAAFNTNQLSSFIH